MRANVGLNQRQARFVSLVASGEHSVTEAHVLAGYGTKRDSANAHKLAKSLAEFISAERTRLGVPEPDAEEPVIDDADIAALLAQARQVYALAIEANDLAAANKANRTIERLLRRPKPGGRPVAEKPAPSPTSQPAGSGRPVSELIDLLLTDEDLAEIETAHPPHIEEAWLHWRQGGPSSEYLRTAYGVNIAEEPSDPSALMSTASPIALAQAEIVKRL